MKSPMQAMIFAAGLGTRLQPVTHSIPKALIEVAGKPMLRHVIEKLMAAGVINIVINLHHFPELIRNYLSGQNNFGANIQFSDETDQLLDTGGGLKKAAALFEPGLPVVIHNVDVISDIDLNRLYQYHMTIGSLATLFVQKRPSSRYLIFDEDRQLTGWKNTKTSEVIQATIPNGNTKELAFNGIHIVNPEIFQLMTEDGKFSIIPTYLRLASHYKIIGFQDDSVSYIDIGKPENLAEAEKRFG